MDEDAAEGIGRVSGGAVGGVYGNDAALPRGLDIDAAGEAVALQLADDLEVGSLVEDRGVERRTTVADDEAVVAAQPLAQRPGGCRVLVGVVDAAALTFEPVPVGEGLQASEIGGSQVDIAHVVVAGDEDVGSGIHGLSLLSDCCGCGHGYSESQF